MNMVVAGWTIAFWFVALGGGLYWTRRYVRAIEAKAGEHERIAALEARLAALEATQSQSLAAPRTAEPARVAAPASTTTR